MKRESKGYGSRDRFFETYSSSFDIIVGRVLLRWRTRRLLCVILTRRRRPAQWLPRRKHSLFFMVLVTGVGKAADEQQWAPGKARANDRKHRNETGIAQNFHIDAQVEAQVLKSCATFSSRARILRTSSGSRGNVIA